MKRRIAEAGWVIGGQAATALGTVVGVRVLTQFLNPAVYGTVSLVLGISTLAISLVAAPLTQAAIHFYPRVVAEGSVRDLLEALQRCFRTMAPWVVVTMVVGGLVYITQSYGSPVLVMCLVGLVVCDCWRAANLSLLNAARRQGRFGLWMAADAWARPLAATAAVVYVGQTAVAVLASYLVVSVCLLAVFSYRLWPRASSRDSGFAGRARSLDSQMWAYALPLMPLGIVGWASSLGDRYVIGGVLSVADAGMYAAVYGLASSPFMIVVGTAEQALRPIYQTAVSQADYARARKILTLWITGVAVICALGVLAFVFGHKLFAAIAVGKTYRHASGLMPWIALGYAIRAVSYVFERVCYAYGQTRRVLVIQVCAACATVIVTPVGVLALGLRGAAMAVPVYFSVQLAIAIWLARRTIRETHPKHPDTGVESPLPTGA
jgi:O-antigen/teichoic acid export membrane protein